jgi:SPX domain protein involved in polyphosphate accumulation
LLQLVQFIDLNVTGIRKILKKHDKITRTRLSSAYFHYQNDNLSPLLRDDTIASLVRRVEEAWREQQKRIEMPGASLDRSRAGKKHAKAKRHDRSKGNIKSRYDRGLTRMKSSFTGV